MIRLRRTGRHPVRLGVAALLLGVSTLAAPAGAACRLALALGLDVSGSVSAREYQLQRSGLAAALVNREVTAVFFSQPGAFVRLAIYEWSGPGHQQVLVNWTEIVDRTALDRLVAQLLTAGSGPDGARRRDLSTALGTAMQTGAGLLAGQTNCWQRKLDISGDGKQNTGPNPRNVRAVLEHSGLTINALAIGADNPRQGDIRMVEISELVSYFRAYVLLGPDAFVETALSFDDFESAMVRKLKREMESPILSLLPTPRNGPPHRRNQPPDRHLAGGSGTPIQPTRPTR